MARRKDHRVEFYLDGKTYLALRYVAAEANHTVSEHLRALVEGDLEKALSEEDQNARGNLTGQDAETGDNKNG